MTDDEIKHRLVEKLWGEPLRATIWEKDVRKGTMTDDEIRIAVAEQLGWKLERHHNECGWDHYTWTTTDPNGKFVGDFSEIGLRRTLPDYPNDLNACREMEEVVFNKKDWTRYTDFLIDTVISKDESPIRATARQRCEAFLRVKGKWKEKPRE